MPERCKDCGIRITKKQKVSRCKPCQVIRTKELARRRTYYRLGSPKLYKRLSNGRIIPENYKLGVNHNREYPRKKQPWMKFTWDLNGNPVDLEQVLRQQALNNKQFPVINSWVRVTLYNWKYDIDNAVPRMTRELVYKNWKYYRNI